MIKTRLTERFGIEHPIVGAPMALVTGGALAAAVTAAGGLGILAGGYAKAIGEEPGLEEQHRLAGNRPVRIGFITWAAGKRPDVVDWAIGKRPKCLFLSFGCPKIIAKKAVDADISVEAKFGEMKQIYNDARTRGDLDIAATIVGEAVGLIHAKRPAAEIISEMVAGAESTLARANLSVS